MALPRPPMGPPGGPARPSIEDIVDQGGYVRTNREREGSWQGYLNAIRKTPDYSAGNATFFETPADRTRTPAIGGGKSPTPLPVGAGRPRGRSGGVPTKSGSNASVGPRYGAGREVAPGTPEANYTAGIRRYGSGMRSAPNIGAVSDKSGYNERDRKLAAQRNASLATGDALSRVRTLGG